MVYQKISFKLSNPQLHVVSWALLIGYEVLVAYSFGGKLSSFFDYAGHYMLNIGLFYANTYLVLQRARSRSKSSVVLVIVLVLLEFIVYMLLKKVLYACLLYYGIYVEANMPGYETFFIQSLWRFIYFIGISTGYWFALSGIQQARVIAGLEKQRLEDLIQKETVERQLLIAENSYLKAQIDPHFLFNVLGFIHNQVYKVSATAGETVTLLADMMRYSFSNSQLDQEVTALSEVEHIRNYVTINQYRFGHRLKLELRISGNAANAKIPPLLLMTIIENVFKYGELVNPEEAAVIDLFVGERQLKLFIRNQKNERQNIISSGTGMSNVVKRLELHYKDNYVLDIRDTEKHYQLQLTIIFK